MDDMRFYILSTVFQSYQADGQVLMEGCEQWKPFTFEKISPRAGLELGTLRMILQG